MNCQNCGREIATENQSFCQYCGKPLTMPANNSQVVEDEVPKEVRDLLAPNEKTIYVAKQKGSKFKPDLTKRIFPDMIVLTDRRILQMQPKGLIRGALGMRDYVDYPYEDMRSILLKRGAFRSTICITWKSQLDKGKQPEIKDIDKCEAEDIYGIVREILTKQETKVTAVPIMMNSQPVQNTDTPIQQLERLSKLRQSGFITEEEFQVKKKELLTRI